MKKLTIALTLALSLVPIFATAKTTPPARVAMTPSENQAQAALWSARMLRSMHYRSVALDDALSQEIFKRMLESMDGEHWFFTQADVAEFAKYKVQLDDAIQGQTLEAPFVIFNRYLQRVKERTAYAQGLLKKPFDYTAKERFYFDREKAAWAKDTAELNNLWRLRVKNDALRLSLAGKDQAYIAKTLGKRYDEFQRRVLELDGDDVFSMFMNAYALSIEPHTSYLSPRASENFNMNMRLSLDGIGALLQRDGDYTLISSLVKGGPAQRGGELKEFDRVIAVGQGDSGEMVDVVGWRVDDVVDLIRGKRGTTVRLEVLGADDSVAAKPRLIKIVRDKVKLEEQAAKKSVIEYTEAGRKHRVGVINLPAFYIDFQARARGDADYRSSTRDVSKLINELKAEKVDALLIDLRNNGGGSLSEAAELTGLFIDQGPVVQVRNPRGRVEIYEDPNRGVLWSGPLAVMTNRGSASASEIFAGAIQDYKRGLILGETTFGKGTVQQIVELDRIGNKPAGSLGELKMTIQQFFRVSGGSTQHKGVVPDIAFPETIDFAEFGESSYENALPYTEVPVAEFKAWPGVSGADIALIAKRFEARAPSDQEYRFLVEDLAERKRLQAEKSVSLLLSERQAERIEQETKRKQRLAARKAVGDAKAEEKSDTIDDGLDFNERRLETRKANERNDEIDLDDPYLKQAVRIVGDVVALSDKKLRAALMAEPLSKQIIAKPVALN